MSYNKKQWLVYGTDYTVTNSNNAGGILTLLTPLPEEAEQFVIMRFTPKTQEYDLQEGSRLSAELIESMSDKMTMTLQEIYEQKMEKDTEDNSVESLFEAVIDEIQNIQEQELGNRFDLKADLDSPDFTGTPTVPYKDTPATENGTLIATEKQVKSVSEEVKLVSEEVKEVSEEVKLVSEEVKEVMATFYHVGRTEVQYPVEGAATLEDMFPEEEAPATLYGGVWTLMYDTEGVSFRTPGTGDTDETRLGAHRGQQWNDTTETFEDGMPGVEPDAGRPLRGRSINGLLSGVAVPEGGTRNGIIRNNALTGFTLSGSPATAWPIYGSSYFSTFVYTPVGGGELEIDTSWGTPTDIENRVKNRLIRVWKKTA